MTEPEESSTTAATDFWIRQTQDHRLRCIQFALNAGIASMVQANKVNLTTDLVVREILSAAREFEEYIVNG